MATMLEIEPIIEKFTMLFRGDTLTTFALQSGFVKRKPRKIDPRTFLVAFFITVIQSGSSLTSLATTLGLLKRIRISKQAIDKRIGKPLIEFLQSVLGFTIARKIHNCTSTLASKFKRILVQDSSTIRLPSHLADEFPGSKNGVKDDIALLKVQALYDLLKEQFTVLLFTPFTTNDQKAATTLLDYINEGDLLIRDLGYFVLSAFSVLSSKGAYFITRLRYGIVLSDQVTGERLNLLKLLNKHQKLDLQVVLGTVEKVTVRLIALPVDPAIADERRRKLKANRDRRLNPSKEHLALLGWNIFVLNIDDQTLTPEEVAQLYGLRWRIEIIFKAWKSNFSFAAVPRASAVRVQTYVYAFFIFITLFQTFIFSQTYNSNNHTNEKQLSLLKFSRFFKEQFWAIVLYMLRPAVLYDQIRFFVISSGWKSLVNRHLCG